MNTGERWRRVRELFERAFEEKPADVPAWTATASTTGSCAKRCSRSSSIMRAPDPFSTTLRARGWRSSSPTIIRSNRGSFLANAHRSRHRQRRSGRIYLANDERLGRRVALKALSPDLTADPSHRERLRREECSSRYLHRVCARRVRWRAVYRERIRRRPHASS